MPLFPASRRLPSWLLSCASSILCATSVFCASSAFFPTPASAQAAAAQTAASAQATPSVQTAASAQSADRIWGKVHTVSGDVYEGFVRWDRNEGGWVDILDGSKDIPEANYQEWIDAARGGKRPVRAIELEGYRVTWDEEDPDFPMRVTSGIRFGHLAGLIAAEGDSVRLVLRSGEWQEFTGGSTDIGPQVREIVVDDPDGDLIELEWEDLDRIEFNAAPPGVEPRSPRLYGTVEDDTGRRFTGYISWDLDEILESDLLEGHDDGGKERSIPFREIRAIERRGRRGATVTLATGEERDLRGSNDVDRGHRGVQISDPELGMVEVEWRNFRSLDLAPVPAVPGYQAFDGGHPLEGVVASRSGDELRGRVRWDADEEWSWELLDGRSEGIRFAIEFGKIRCIEPVDEDGAAVTLHDGRTFHLEDSNDVSSEGRGVMVLPFSGAGASPTAGAADWRYVPWEDLLRVCFDAPSQAAEP